MILFNINKNIYLNIKIVNLINKKKKKKIENKGKIKEKKI